MKKLTLLISASLALLVSNHGFSQTIYDNGIYTGEYLATYSNGNKKAAGRLEQNQRVGNWEFYSEHGVLVAKINYQSNTEFKTIETRNHLKSELKIPLNDFDKLYALPLEEKTISWAKRIYRDIAASEFKLSSSFNFFQYLRTVQTDKPLCFDNDQFQTPFKSVEDIPHSNELIIGYRIKMDYFFRKDYNFMDSRIVGIAPLYKTSDGETKEICWLYYHGLKDQVFENIKNKEKQSMESLLQTKNYHSIIYKELNITNETVEQLSADITEQKKRYLEIDNSIIEAENDLIIKSYF